VTRQRALKQVMLEERRFSAASSATKRNRASATVVRASVFRIGGLRHD
jgi:hypothetical protein